ncbi:MAG: formate dehydrogenase accessory sulfurtransferase FdhD [Myxococcota bacterium]|nr:formate dehydrogenase accessory sulfurtransferase FdhD [Myxococcota bacterium]
MPSCTTDGDHVASEEPLEIRVNGQPVAVVMRSPGADRQLGAGFMMTEGIIDGPDDIRAIAHCTDPNRMNRDNVLLIQLEPGYDRQRLDRARRTLYTSSSCGICGKTSLENVFLHCPPRTTLPHISMHVLHSLEDRVRMKQTGFGRTGGLHAAAQCAPDGQILSVYEDVGRHNAVDKLVGAALMSPTERRTDTWLWISGRASFEVVQKAHLGGFACVVAVGAPTSLAVDLSKAANLGLVGFCRDGRANIYSGIVAPEK